MQSLPGQMQDGFARGLAIPLTCVSLRSFVQICDFVSTSSKSSKLWKLTFELAAPSCGPMALGCTIPPVGHSCNRADRLMRRRWTRHRNLRRCQHSCCQRPRTVRRKSPPIRSSHSQQPLVEKQRRDCGHCTGDIERVVVGSRASGAC